MKSNPVITPSQSPYPVFVLCPPTYADIKIANNIWMTSNKEVRVQDREKFMSQWVDLYGILSASAVVYLLPPKPEFQDMTYVNSFVYLPHIKDRNIIVLSNFTAKGRAGEEIVAGKYLRELGYEIHSCPYKFEGCPELKYSGKDNVYYGGYGIRTDIRALEWLEQKFNCKIVKIKETDPYLYHLDCSLFVLNKDNVMAYIDETPIKTLKEIEKYATIHPISIDAAYQGATNSVRVSTFVLNASSIDYMRITDKYYKEEEKKNKELEKICLKLGLELIFTDLSESMLGGALLSCHCTPLNHLDLEY